jgi:hypothetical protein
MKHALLSLFFFTSSSVFAQSKLPVDAVTGKVVFKSVIHLRKDISNETAFSLAEDWFNNNKKQFSRFNHASVIENEKPLVSKARQEVETVFENKTPLQSIDPASNRLSGKVIVHYQGNSGGSIQHLYVQYSLILQIENQELRVTASELTYNHFNRNTFREQRFLNFSNSNACDAVNYMEYLVDCENRHEEFATFYNFLNQDVKSLFNNLETFMKGNQALTFNSSVNSDSKN